MASDLLPLLAKANLVGSLAILIVALTRRPVRAWAGAGAAYGLWLVVPLMVAASFLPARTVVVTLTGSPGAPLAAAATPIPVTWPEAPASLDLSLVATLVWAAGAAFGLALVAFLQWRSLRRLGRLKPVDSAIPFLTARLAGFGPAVVGALRPRIVAPADFEILFTERERAVVLAHEAVHLARQDARINALVVVCQCIDWFNPLVHLAAHLLRLDQELACDAAVMARYPEARRAYAEAMLKTQVAPASLPLGCYWPARSEHPLKERLAMLKTSPAGRGRRIGGAVIVSAVAVSAAAAAWAAQPVQTIVHTVTAPAAGPVTSVALDLTPNVAQPIAAPQAAAAPKAAPPAAQVAPAPVIQVAQAGAAPAERPSGWNPNPPPGLTGMGKPVYKVVPGDPELKNKGFAALFNAEAPVTFKGVVTSVDWIEPRGFVHMTDTEGKQWMVMGGSPSNIPLDQRGQIAPGTTLIVRGYKAWDTDCSNGGCLVNGREVTFEDGRKPFVGR